MKKEIKGLNGLRAIAVILVLIYHFYPNILPGGFLGVDFFFVLSGYLITSILINEEINILDFYYKRFKRLLPLCYFMLLLIIVIMGLTNHDWLIEQRQNILASFVYNLNLHNILSGSDYFSNFDLASPVKHLWSLAIEMKFYILFPILFIGKPSKNRIRITFLFLIIVSITSSIILYSFYKPDIKLVYNLLVTRMYALLIGAMFATYIDTSKLKRIKVNPIGYILLIIAIIPMVYMNEVTIYRYQIIYIFSIIFGIIIITLANSKILGKLNYIGNISYGIYVFHFAIFSLTTPFEEYSEPNLLHISLRLIVTIILSIFTYHFIETPIRRNGFTKFFENYFNLLVLLFLSTLSFFIMLGANLETFPYRLVEKSEVGENILMIDTSKLIIPEVRVKEVIEEKVEEKIPETKGIYKNTLLIGDSLAINVSKALATIIPYLEVDAQTGRYLFDAITIADKYKNYNNSDSAVIIMLGTNGEISRKQVDRLVKKFDKADIYFVNINVPRFWNDGVNKVLKEATDEIDNAYLIDWETTSLNHKEYFRKDRVHVNEIGASVFIDLIKNSLKKDIDTNSEKKPKFHIINELRNNTTSKKGK